MAERFTEKPRSPEKLQGALGYPGQGMESSGGGLEILGSDSGASPSSRSEAESTQQMEKRGGYVIYLSSDIIGPAGGAHGGSLMNDFLYTLTEIAPPPQAIILVSSAVRLAQPGSPAIESLSLMQEQGVRILLADTSLREIGGGNDIAVGRAATLHSILQALLRAEKVITL